MEEFSPIKEKCDVCGETPDGKNNRLIEIHSYNTLKTGGPVEYSITSLIIRHDIGLCIKCLGEKSSEVLEKELTILAEFFDELKEKQKNLGMLKIGKQYAQCQMCGEEKNTIFYYTTGKICICEQCCQEAENTELKLP